MFKSKKDSKQPKRPKGEGAAMMAQMGFQIPNFDEPGMGAEDDDDGDFEAELNQLANIEGGQQPKRAKQNQRKSGGAAQDLNSFHTDVNKLLHDIDKPMKDDDLSDVDEDDLLAELNEMTGDMETEDQEEPTPVKPTASSSSSADTSILSVLESRRQMYVKAVETAKASQDAAKTRRLDRQLKTIQSLIQSARSGAAINPDEIPPSLSIGGAPPSQSTDVDRSEPVRAPSLPRPPPPPSLPAAPLPKAPSGNNSEQEIARLKALALKASEDGDKEKARQYIVQYKALQNAASSAVLPSRPPPVASDALVQNEPDDESSGASALPLKAPVPRTILESLQQRHDELTKRHKEAVSSADSSKARRLDRQVKQYQEAMDATRKGRPYDYSELPDLPGFAPIPVQPIKPSPAAGVVPKPVAAPQSVRPVQPVQLRAPPPVAAPASQTASTAFSANPQKDQQLQDLRLKKENFLRLALQAKKEGDREAALKHMAASKGIEQMIKAAESEAPIDMNEIVNLPTGGFEVIREDDLTEELAKCDPATVYQRLEDDLLRQVQLCARNQQIYAHMEGANNLRQANDYKFLEQRSAHDLERLRQSSKKGHKPPVFHYEKRQMHLIQVNTDLGDNELEVNVVRGINLHVPSGYTAKALETNVIFEFPYPTETPQTARTRHTTGSMNAEYPDAVHRFTIKRADTKLARAMGRKELKLAVYHKAGFLRADRLLGTATLKLAALEHSATIHESVDVYDAERKKKAEGKLEVKVRIKEALGVNKASELTPQKWLVIDRFEDTPVNQRASLAQHPKEPEAKNESDRNSQQQSSSPVGPQSFKVLKFEADAIGVQIEHLEDYLPPDQIQLLKNKKKSLEEQAERIIENLGKGGKQAVKEHSQALQQLVEQFDQEATEHQKRNDKKKVDLFLTKKELVLKEIATLADPPAKPVPLPEFDDNVF